MENLISNGIKFGKVEPTDPGSQLLSRKAEVYGWGFSHGDTTWKVPEYFDAAATGVVAVAAISERRAKAAIGRSPTVNGKVEKDA